MLTRIFTKNHKNLPDIVSQFFEGFTILTGIGFWKGKAESCAVIEIDSVTSDYNYNARIDSIVKKIKTECNQKHILVQKLQITGEIR